MKLIKSTLVIISTSLLLISGVQAAGEHPMGFFITSKGIGNGGDLGSLSGADAHCAKLARAAGAGGRERRAETSAPMLPTGYRVQQDALVWVARPGAQASVGGPLQ